MLLLTILQMLIPSIIANSPETDLLIKVNDNLLSKSNCDYNMLFILDKNNGTATQNLSKMANENGISSIRFSITPKYSVKKIYSIVIFKIAIEPNFLGKGNISNDGKR